MASISGLLSARPRSYVGVKSVSTLLARSACGSAAQVTLPEFYSAKETMFVDPVTGAVSYGVFNFNTGHGARVSDYRGFGFHNHDFALQKTASITERVKFQFRAEVFNLWNWHFFSRGTVWLAEGDAFVSDLASPAFGTATGAVTTPRNIQMGAKIIF